MDFSKIIKEVPDVLKSIKRFFYPKKNTEKDDGTRNILAPEELTYEECEQFMPLRDGDVVYILKVYDGDTCTLGWVDHAGNKVRSSCRIKGIDTPEIRCSSDYEKSLALKAKNRLKDLIMGEFVTIRNPGVEKYGRVLAFLHIDAVGSVSEHMLADPSICVPYDGGTKHSWD